MLLWLKRKWSTPAACLSINWMALGSTVMGLATSMLAYLNVSNIAGVAVQLQKKDPEKYP